LRPCHSRMSPTSTTLLLTLFLLAPVTARPPLRA
jgi:hypothetical protein